MSVNSKMKAIADAIRAKTGGTAALTLDGMAEAVAGIEAGGGDDLARQLVDNSITELSGSFDRVGEYALSHASVKTVDLPLCTEVKKYAFDTCRSLTSVSLPSCTTVGERAFYSSGSVSMSVHMPMCTNFGNGAFYSSKIANADFPLCTVAVEAMFNGCTALTSVNLPNCTSIGSSAFSGCTNLPSVRLPQCTSVGSSGFYKCSRLATVDLPVCTRIGSDAFYSSYSLTSIILRAESVCSLANTKAFNYCYHILGTINSAYNPNGLKDGYIYVPDNLVEDYKAATNWSTFASQIRPLSEYVEVTA